MLNRRTVLTAAALAHAAFAFSRPVLAAEPEVFAEDGIAIRGADAVAYFTRGEPVIGDPVHAVMWRGAAWHFAGSDTMEQFMANPEAYAPQYGGYCAYAVSQGYVATSVPDAWTIHEDKLYLNFSRSVRRRWERDIPGHVAAGNSNWPTVLG